MFSVVGLLQLLISSLEKVQSFASLGTVRTSLHYSTNVKVCFVALGIRV